jgi:DNA-binding NtrC family response regulator
MSAEKILLVDDSALARRAVRQMLESAGCAVAGRRTVDRARALLLESPDLVLLRSRDEGMNDLICWKKLTEMDGRRG